jgi:hypothetical protein
MRLLGLAVTLFLVSMPSATGQDPPTFPLPDLLQAAPLPKGYLTNTHDLKFGDYVIGHIIVVGKPNEFSKVTVQIEMRDLSDIKNRRKTANSYINGLTTTLANAGFKVVEAVSPDLEKESFDKPISASGAYANSDGKKLWTYQEISFTDKGFLVQIVADDPETLKSLTEWAKSVKPKPKS